MVVISMGAKPDSEGCAIPACKTSINPQPNATSQERENVNRSPKMAGKFTYHNPLTGGGTATGHAARRVADFSGLTGADLQSLHTPFQHHLYK